MVDLSNIRIAIVEDDHALCETLCDMLEQEGYTAINCPTGGSLQQLLLSTNLDLILLDLKLPDGSGLELITKIRVTDPIPIIIISGKSDEIDRVVGLEMGADDYVVKPFSVRELLARVRALLRRQGAARERMQGVVQPQRGYRFDGWTLDTDRRKLFRPDGEPVVLTVAEFDLLSAILSANGRVLSRDQLLEMTRRENDDVFDRTIDVLILRLRRKIEVNAQQPRFIRTERGVGYTFSVPIERLAL